MGDIINISSIHDYNDFLGIETLNPLVTFIDFREVKVLKHKRKYYGFYGIYLKEKIHGKLTYGRSQYDYQEGTLVFVAPGQVAGIDDGGETLNPEGYALLFHPDLLRGTSLARKMKEYTFFSYEVNEALHMSERERQTIFNCFAEIQEELHHTIDKHSRGILTSNIEVLLNHCLRFYDRQFTTRAETNKDVLVRFERLLDEYLQSDLLRQEGLPTVRYFAEKICLSPNYFGDLIKKETGKTAQENIQDRIISLAKEWILGTNKTVSQIAYDLGFQYSQHFSRIFKKTVGCTPNEYRKSQMS